MLQQISVLVENRHIAIAGARDVASAGWILLRVFNIEVIVQVPDIEWRKTCRNSGIGERSRQSDRLEARTPYIDVAGVKIGAVERSASRTRPNCQTFQRTAFFAELSTSTSASEAEPLFQAVINPSSPANMKLAALPLARVKAVPAEF